MIDPLRGSPARKVCDEDVLMLTPFAPQVTISIIEIPLPNQKWNFIRLVQSRASPEAQRDVARKAL